MVVMQYYETAVSVLCEVPTGTSRATDTFVA
jgi:hypothetical protein